MRIVTVASILFMLFAGACKSAPQTRPETDKIETAASLPEAAAELPVPADMLVLVRMQPDKFEGLLREATSTVGMRVPPIERGMNHALLVGVLEGTMTGIGQSSSAEQPELDGLVATQASYIAVSSAASAEKLQMLARGVPTTSVADLPDEVLLRVMVPVRSFEDLKTSVEAHCAKSDGAGCETLTRIEDAGRWAALDFVVDPSATDSAADEAPRFERETPAFVRATPAVADFWAARGAVDVYTTEPPVSLAGMAGATEITDVLPGVPDARKQRAFWAGLHQVLLGFELESSHAREVEDASMSLSSTDSGAISARLVQSFTEYGATIMESATEAPELPVIAMDDAQIEFDFVGLGSDALSQVRVPEWMDASMQSLASRVRKMGGWGYAITLQSYPLGLINGLQESAMDQPSVPDSAVDVRDTLAHLRGIRGRLAIEPPSTFQGVAVRGAVAMAFPSDVDVPIQAWLSGTPIGQLLGDEVQVTSDVRGDLRIFRIWAGVDEAVFGDEYSTVETGAFMRSDLVGGSARNPLMALGAGLGDISLAMRQTATARAVTLTAGADQRGHLTLPDATAEPVAPASFSECRRVLRDITMRGLQLAGSGETLVAAAEQTIATLEDSECAEAEWSALVEAGWRDVMAQAYAADSRWQQAAEQWAASCDAGLERSCERAESARDRVSTSDAAGQ